jgi:hypothetical protein
MSDNKKKTARRANDDYQTPIGVVSPLLALIDWPRVRSFCEPARGDGVIYKAAAERMEPHGFGRLEWHEIRDGRDYLTAEHIPVDLLITNPPFSHAIEFVNKSLEEAATVCYLLPLGFLSSRERRDWWRSNPPTHVITVSERPCFVWVCRDRHCKGSCAPGVEACPACGGRTKRQTDFSDVAWYVWDRGRLLTTRAPFVWI